MSLEDRFAQHDKVVVDKYETPTGNFWMSTRDYVLRPYANAESGAYFITLPPVGEAKGRFYSIIAREASVLYNITITDRRDSECWPGDIVMDGKCDRALLYSDGLSWITGLYMDPQDSPS